MDFVKEIRYIDEDKIKTILDGVFMRPWFKKHVLTEIISGIFLKYHCDIIF